MDANKIGQLIAQFRKEKQLTQKNIADELGLQSKTVSKWETGQGLPAITYWPQLSEILDVDLQQLMAGEIATNPLDVGKMSLTKFYVCPTCRNMLFSTSPTSVTCCSRQLDVLTERELVADIEISMKATIEVLERELYISFDHPMSKEHYLAFVALVNHERVYFDRLYPEQSASTRLPNLSNAQLYVYCNRDGLVRPPLS